MRGHRVKTTGPPANKESSKVGGTLRSDEVSSEEQNDKSSEDCCRCSKTSNQQHVIGREPLPKSGEMGSRSKGTAQGQKPT